MSCLVCPDLPGLIVPIILINAIYLPDKKRGKKMQSEPFMPSLQEILENKNAISIIRVEYDPI